MTLLQLQYFQALAYTLHYTRTAEELHISQPSLSYAIGELEKELGVELFRREKKQLALTDYGRVFLPYVEEALHMLTEGREQLALVDDSKAQVVRIGYIHSISSTFIPHMVQEFYHENSNKIRFKFVEAPSFELFSLVKSGDLDMAFCLHKDAWASSEPIIRQPLYLAVSVNHRLAKKKAVTCADFIDEPQIMLEHSTNLRGIIEKLFSEMKASPSVVVEVRECNAALQYVSMNLGVAIMPEIPSINYEKIKMLPITDHLDYFTRTVCFTYHKNRPLSPAGIKVRSFIEDRFVLSEE